MRIGKMRAAEASWRGQVLRGSGTTYTPRTYPVRALGWIANAVGCFVIVSVLDIIATVAGFETWIRRMWP